LKTTNILINKAIATKYLLFFSILCYFLSVSRFSVNVLDNKLYFLKHFIILLPSIFILFEFSFLKDIKANKDNIFYILFLSLIILPFLIRGIFNIGELIIFFQLFLFLLSCYYYSNNFNIITSNIKKSDFYILIIIFFIPLILNIILENGDFIYNTYYGRPRLLLGYFHPKEGAICLVTILIFYQLYYKFLFNKKFNLIFNIISILLMYFMQSRNIFLFYINFLLLNILISKFNIKIILLFYFVIPFIIISIIIFFYFKEINILFSNRLDWWFQNIKISPFGNGSYIANYSKTNVLSKLHVDNFYLEYLIENGYILFSILFYFLYRVVILINKFKLNTLYYNSIFISFLFFCFFDAGMFSSGNLLNFIVWVITFSGINTITKINLNEAF
jgi:hypothetical protein